MNKSTKLTNILKAIGAIFLKNAITQNRPSDSRLQTNTDLARLHHEYHYSII